MSSVQGTAIDLFCGMGGMSHGLASAGLKILYAIDFEDQAIGIHKLNHSGTKHECADVRNINPESTRKSLSLKKGDVTLVAGGPPCQGFSTYGQRNPDDERNFLFRRFADFIEEFRPRFFIMENVVGLLSMEGGSFFDGVITHFEELGYSCKVMRLNAANFGTPQLRRRVLVVGSRDKEKIEFPQPLYRMGEPVFDPADQFSLFEVPKAIYAQQNYNRAAGSSSLPPARTVSDALSDLPEQVFPPSRNNEAMPYPDSDLLTEYQAVMRNGSDCLRNHSSKRHLARRMIRTSVMGQGDYGKDNHSKVATEGVPDAILELVAVGKLDERMLHGARNIDKKAEAIVIEKLRSGGLSKEEVDEYITAGGFANKYRRLHWDEPSHTLVAHMARDCSDFIHPTWNRPISVREAARLQSFPDSYRLCGSQFRQLRFIGNALPPLLAKAVAEAVLSAQ